MVSDKSSNMEIVIKHTPQVQEPGAQPQLAQEQEVFPQPPIVDDF